MSFGTKSTRVILSAHSRHPARRYVRKKAYGKAYSILRKH